MSLDTLLNFHQSTARIGTAGQPTPGQLELIAAEGYGAVVNLAMHNSDNAIANEGNLVASLGMAYIHLPVPFEAPTAGHLRKFIRVMDALEGEKIFVHCAINARVSAFMFKYLTLCKATSAADATSPLLKSWLPDMDPAWKTFLALSADDLGL